MLLALEIFQTIVKVVYAIIESFILAILPSSFLPKKSVAGEIALITGAGSGIGRLTALRLAKLGAKLVLWDVNSEGLEVTRRMIQEAGGQAHVYECDVTDRFLVYLTADRVRDEVGDVTILVNNAGIVSGKPFLETPDEKLQKTMDVNATAHFWTLKAFLPRMLELKHGHIVTISSIAGKISAARLVDYCASKYAAVGLHEALVQEFRASETGVHLTNVCPFFINTGMFGGLKIRFPSILPGLDQHYVADRIVKAIEYNEPEVVIPATMKLTLILNLLLPTKASGALSELLGVRSIMSSFVGRDGAAHGQATTTATITEIEYKSKSKAA
ncbi:Epidermal retinol dehydrogenase 2 [Hypsibius exemplaris]|uniref:Epidermal retinol dehydrogenase 2 n=1 Tax=Hypsibius exemplaris TaxID=2072580 RepID=A0A1W0X2Y4_HYPEX|nr:Epidermal retinol dehydrogenase 2 [Hypsibius exemplaris]